MPRRQRSPTGGQANFYISNFGEFGFSRLKWQKERRINRRGGGEET